MNSLTGVIVLFGWLAYRKKITERTFCFLDCGSGE